MKQAAAALIVGMIAAGLVGCRDRARQAGAMGPKPYFGPTEPMADVVAAINANNAAIPTLRAAGDFEANVVDQGRRRFVNGEIVMLYRSPGEVRLVGTKDVAGRIFDAGNNAEHYWLIIKGETDTMWYGRIDNLDQVDPRELPIRPDLLVEVLAIDPIDTNFLTQPVPVMRFNNDADAYMFTFNVQLPNRWATQKEVWYDRQTKLPRMVLLFDENGRIVLRAYLSNHLPVEGATIDGGPPPRVAGRYQLFFPESGTTLRYDVADLALERRGAPNARSFAFPADPGVSRVINLDEQARQP